jgi:putative Mg2+ transporter-C (MgtC) family protein
MTVIYLLVSSAYPAVERILPRSRFTISRVRLTYREGEGVLRGLLGTFGKHGFSVSDLAVEHSSERRGHGRAVTVRMEVRGPGSLPELASHLDDIEGVLKVSAAEDQRLDDA